MLPFCVLVRNDTARPLIGRCVIFDVTQFNGKGSLRRAKPRRALACCSPSRRDHYAMGGSGGNTGRSFTAPHKTNAEAARVLDRVAPYQFSEGFSAWSTTKTSMIAFCGSNLSPSCSCTAVKMMLMSFGSGSARPLTRLSGV
jgi:hypothetical protein